MSFRPLNEGTNTLARFPVIGRQETISFDNSHGLGTQVIFTAGAFYPGSRIDIINVISNDAVANVFRLHIGNSTNLPIVEVPINANAGTDGGSTPAVAVLGSTQFENRVLVDNNLNRYLVIPPNYNLFASFTTAITVGSQIDVSIFGGDY